jgi:HEAT repeat protein
VNGLARALKIRAGEGRIAGSTIALSFLVMAGQTIGLSAVTGLFLERVGTDALPRAYLLQGGGALAVMLALAAMLGRVDQRPAFLGMGAGLAVVVFAERLVLLADPTWIYWALWLTVAVAVIVQTVFVWGIAGTVTDARQAKRLFPLFAAGGIVGSVLGGLLTGPIGAIVGTTGLITVWGVTLVAAAVLGGLLLPRTTPRPVHRLRPSALGELSSAMRYVARSPLLVWMTIAAVLFSVLFYSLFLPWAGAAADRYPHADDLAAFIGVFTAATTAGAFLVSTLATNRIFARFGIATAVLVLPLLYVGSFGVLLVSAGFVTLVTARAVTGVWLQGVASPGWETLTNVVPDARRDQVRAFLNGGPAQAGTAIAGVIALAGADALTPRQLTLIGLVTACATVFVTWHIRRSYASALVDALRAGRPVFTTTAIPRVPLELDRDAQALDSVLEAARDPSPAVRRLAVQLLADVHDERVEPILDEASGDDDAVIAASAAAILVGRSDDPKQLVRLRELVADPDPSIRTGALRALDHAPPEIGAPLAAAALVDTEPAVRAAALLTLASLDPSEGLAHAISMLEDPSPLARHAAAEACVLIGATAVPGLLAALDGAAARDAAFEALTWLEVAEGHDHIRALSATWAVDAARDRALADGIAADGDAAELLRAALLDRARHNGRLALQALSVVGHDPGSLRAAIENLDARDGGQVAVALETLESAGDPAIVRPLVALWDRSAQAAPAPQVPIEQIARDPDPLIAMCAELILRSGGEGDDVTRLPKTMPTMERVLFLRKVPLFQELSPADLLPIAEIADEQSFADGDLLGHEGEMGDGLHVLVVGAVGVDVGGARIAQRGPGDVVGEMSLITQRPRMASLRAIGDVRTIWISRRAFEGMVHDRPNIAIGVMRVLADRLAER